MLDENDISKLAIAQQSEIVKKALSKNRTLLIIDNLETIDDEAVYSFILELPVPTKAIITTRHRVDVAYPIRLKGMDWKDADLLIQEECKKKSVKLENEDILQLYNLTGGIPLAIVWSIARISFGHSPKLVLKNLGEPSNDIARYCFEKVIGDIRNKPSYKLLAALTILSGSEAREKLGYVADLLDIERDNGLSQLEVLSLVNHEGEKFSMLPLTQEYMKAELRKTQN